MSEARQPRALDGALWEITRTAAVWLACAPIQLYRFVLSPFLPRACRFYPSCSAYALGALRTHGLVRGGWLALKRLLRCHPFHPGGVDPVPPPRGEPTHFVAGSRSPPR